MFLQMFKKLWRREDGGALAELAILIPFLAVMLAAVCEVGRFFQNYATLAKSTRVASRYLSNHSINPTEIGRAGSLALCGKLVCGVGDAPLVNGLSANNICLESTGSPKVTSVTVRIPRASTPCNPMTGAGAAAPYVYTPIFDIGTLLGRPDFSMALEIAPRTTMYYMIN
jgi:Flp pilus assembly pilin Flp